MVLRARNVAPMDITGAGASSNPEFITAMISRNLLAQMGCSPQPSLLERLFSRGFSVKTEFGGVEVQEEEKAATRRLIDALEDLYWVAGALTLKRKQRSLILADEFHDLAKTNAGRAVLNETLNKSVTHSADTALALVWTLFTNSNGDADWFSHQGMRVLERYQPDPSADEVLDMLVRTKNFSPEHAEQIMLVCGRRRRLLAAFLDASKDEVQSATWIDARLMEFKNVAWNHLVDLENRTAAPEDKIKMGEILDRLTSDTSKPSDTQRSELPKPYENPFPNRVLYQGAGKRLFFQSQAIAYIWQTRRKEFPGLSAAPQQPLK